MPLDAGERAVERVAEPVQYEQQARHPQPRAPAVRELVGGADSERGQNPERGQVVGQDPARQPPGHRREQRSLVSGE